MVAGIHAMWTGPEISCPIPANHLADCDYALALPPENATLHPQPGDVVLAEACGRIRRSGACDVTFLLEA